MAILFFLMVVLSIVKLIISDPNAVLSTALTATADGVELALTLVGIYILWMGVIKVATDSGLIGFLSKLMRPLIRFLFGKQSDEVNELLATNISANLIGAGNAATPAAIGAIEKMAEPEQTKVSTPMIMLFILSSVSVQLIPSTILGILETHGAKNASSIIIPTIVTSLITVVLGVFLVKVFSAKTKSAEKGKEGT